jgi:hypothetical protein
VSPATALAMPSRIIGTGYGRTVGRSSRRACSSRGRCPVLGPRHRLANPRLAGLAVEGMHVDAFRDLGGGRSPARPAPPRSTRCERQRRPRRYLPKCAIRPICPGMDSEDGAPSRPTVRSAALARAESGG